jgi:large subunit ribosomal protein L24
MARSTRQRPPKRRIRVGDTVLIVAGKDRGEHGKVVMVDPVRGRVMVEGKNLATKHAKPEQAGGTTRPGQKVSKAMPMDISNVKLIDPHSDKPTRVGRKILGGKLVRYAKVSGEVIDTD